MDSCDVAIVGGGPAGSSCAWGLRNSGLEVVLLDRAAFPRNKLCAGWITPLILDELEFAPSDYAGDRVLQPITGFRLSAIGGPQVEIRGDKIVSYGIRRCEFDEFLLRRSGAQTREGVGIQSIERKGSDWLINGNLRARMLVGAGGHFCPVGRYLGNKGSPAPVLAQEIEFEMESAQAVRSKVAGEVPELFFCRDMLGYGWVFRKGNYLNVGLGRTDSHEISRHVKEFVTYLGQTRGVATPSSGMAGHAYGLWGRSNRKILDDGVLLIGDAAGLAYPESGEGIRPAIESGLMAAQAILAADGDYRRENLALFDTLISARLQREQTRMESLTQLLPRALKEFAGRQLLRTRSFCQNVVVNRWFLRVAEQRLDLGPRPIRHEVAAL
jgi:geranylgeranyl reductase family protein